MKGKIKRIEAQQGRPIREIVLDLAAKHNGNQRKIADELGITSGSMSYWFMKLGLKTTHIVTAPIAEVEHV